MMRWSFVLPVLLCAAPCGAQQIQPSQVGIVYGCDSGLLRRTIVPGPNERPVASLSPGECVLTPERKSLGDLSEKTASAAISSATGKIPATDRSVLVDDTGIVVNAIKADPAIDSLPDVQLMLHDEAAVGDRYDGKQFLRMYAVVDKGNTVTAFVEAGLPSTKPTPPDGATLHEKGTLSVGDVLPAPVVVAPQ